MPLSRDIDNLLWGFTAVISILITVWLTIFGGAERWNGSILMVFLVHPGAKEGSAMSIRIFALFFSFLYIILYVMRFVV